MSSIIEGCGEVIIEKVSFEAIQTVKVVFTPFPHVSECITKASIRGWVQVYRLKQKM